SSNNLLVSEIVSMLQPEESCRVVKRVVTGISNLVWEDSFILVASKSYFLKLRIHMNSTWFQYQ
ncbi:hypothetical protein JW865_05225, partial [Candidatus Bathyarchaeota archaeon]|nr:hypothetical protein [Candidatus Bathyarchaeota archaeon]